MARHNESLEVRIAVRDGFGNIRSASAAAELLSGMEARVLLRSAESDREWIFGPQITKHLWEPTRDGNLYRFRLGVSPDAPNPVVHMPGALTLAPGRWSFRVEVAAAPAAWARTPLQAEMILI